MPLLYTLPQRTRVMLFENTFTISPARTGDANIKYLLLSGWSNQGMPRLWWHIHDEEFDLYSDAERETLVASGDIVDGLVEIDEVAESGITGSAKLSYEEESTGEVTLSYCDEQDLLTWERDLLDHIPDETFLGQPRFEQPIGRAKVYLDKLLRNKLLPHFRRKGTTNEVDLSAIAKPRQLAEAQALYALHLIMLAVNNGDEAIMKLARMYENKALEQLDLTQIELDYDKDDRIDNEANPFGSVFTR